MKRIVLAMIVLVVGAGGMKAQEISLGADVVSSYVWRGIYQGGGASFQPGITFSAGNFSIGTWGNTNWGGENKEVDFTVGYNVAGLSLTLTDYWWEGERVFHYFDHKNTHHFEAGIGYTLPEFFPLSLSWNTMFAGYDPKPEADSKNAYSTYVEASYPFAVKDIGLDVALGFTPWKGLYSPQGFSVTNINLKASKEVKITDRFSLPVFVQVGVNPCAEDVFLVLGISL